MREPATRDRSDRPVPLFSFVSLLAMLIFLAAPTPGAAQDAAEGDAATSDAANAQLIAEGKRLWAYKGCIGCHTVGDGRLSGPDLEGVTQRRQTEWLERFLLETDSMLETDPLAQRMLQLYNYQRMPQVDLRKEDVDALLAYIRNKGLQQGGSGQ